MMACGCFYIISLFTEKPGEWDVLGQLVGSVVILQVFRLDFAPLVGSSPVFFLKLFLSSPGAEYSGTVIDFVHGTVYPCPVIDASRTRIPPALCRFTPAL